MQFRKDPQTILPALKGILKTEGVHAPIYYGKQIENSNTGYGFVHWDSYEAHKAVIDGPSFSAIKAALEPCFGGSGKQEMYHVQFSGPTIALNQPVTEHPRIAKAVVDLLVEASEKTGKMLVWGKTVEDASKYIVIVGYPTVQAHWDLIARPAAAAAVAKLHELCHREHIYHSHLSQYQL
ncbi:hypothetical protein JVU11DRAFT_11584 [Chiua virens]|nr:hypothetical protein JVU11DRAFT_11584 [Chiua virens]